MLNLDKINPYTFEHSSLMHSLSSIIFSSANERINLSRYLLEDEYVFDLIDMVFTEDLRRVRFETL